MMRVTYIHFEFEGMVPSEVAYLKCRDALATLDEYTKTRLLIRLASEIKGYENHSVAQTDEGEPNGKRSA